MKSKAELRHERLTRIWKRKHRDQVREHGRVSYRKLREKVLESLGGRCVCCGEREHMFLSVDHVYGGGTKHRAGTGPSTVLRHVMRLDNPRRLYRLLCHNCNMARGFYGFCPHTSEEASHAAHS